MATVLIVDDSVVDRTRAGALLEKRHGLTELEKRTGLKAVYAGTGREALTTMEQGLPDLVLTDLQMPEMDGLELVEEVRGKYPTVPVILMTAHGSEDIALLALQRGAACYVPKRHLASDLLETVENILALTQATREEQRLLECLLGSESHFVLSNDLSLVPSVGAYVQNNLRRLRFCDEASQLHVTVAVREALVNGIEHGNLEAPPELKDADEKAYRKLLADRRGQAPYRDRRIHVTIKESLEEFACIIRDEGPGFDAAALSGVMDPANLDSTKGRGLFLIRTFMDEVSHNGSGNEITMVKRRYRSGGR